MNIRKTMIGFVCVALTLMTVPIIAYIWKFKDVEIGSDSSTWGVFGDYIGGTLNPIISLASLVVLSYLTYLVALQSSKDNKNLFLLERRMLAYDELAKFINPLNSFVNRIKAATAMTTVYQQLPPQQGAEHLVKIYHEVREICFVFTELHFKLFEFYPRYSHLFKYDFKSTEYKDLLEETRRVGDLMLTLTTDHELIKQLPDAERDLVKLSKLIGPVFSALRSELQTKE